MKSRLIFLCIILWLLGHCVMSSSCSVLKKTVTSTTTTEVKNLDSAKVIKSDSSSSKKVDSTYEREIVIDYRPYILRQPSYPRLDSSVYLDTTGAAFEKWLTETNPEDFIPYIEPSVLAKLSKIDLSRIAKITIKERGVLIKNEETKVSKIDSVKVKTDEKITVKKVDKQKKVSRFPWWILLAIIAIILILKNWRKLKLIFKL